MNPKDYYQGSRGKRKSRLSKFKYKWCEQSDKVVVVGAGASTKKNADLINKYIRDNDSMVFGTNYLYPCLDRMDYTYFGDWHRFKDRVVQINNTLLISVSIVDRFTPGLWELLCRNRECYEVFTRGKRHGNLSKIWKINKNGTFPHGKFSPSGFAIAAIAAMCRPKEMVLVGLDGPIVKNKQALLVKRRFDGAIKKYGTKKKYRIRQKFLSRLVIPFLHNRGIKLYSPVSCSMWNINKRKHQIHTL